VLCFDDLSQQRQFAAKLQAAGMDSAEWGTMQIILTISSFYNNHLKLLVYMIPGINMENGELQI